jgi:hypothetical protein
MKAVILTCGKTMMTKDKTPLAIKGKKYKVFMGLTKIFFLSEANTFETLSAIKSLENVFRFSENQN